MIRRILATIARTRQPSARSGIGTSRSLAG
jgi:hypothetical protein